MAQTLCIKCGSDLKASSYCHLCQEPLIFACTSCDYITEEKVHTDCRNAEVLAKTASTTEVGTAAAANITKTPRLIAGKQEESILDKPKQETVKAELRSAQSYMTAKQDDDNKNTRSNLSKPVGIITPLDFTRYQEYSNDKEKDTIEKILEYYI